MEERDDNYGNFGRRYARRDDADRPNNRRDGGYDRPRRFGQRNDDRYENNYYNRRDGDNRGNYNRRQYNNGGERYGNGGERYNNNRGDRNERYNNRDNRGGDRYNRDNQRYNREDREDRFNREDRFYSNNGEQNDRRPFNRPRIARGGQQGRDGNFRPRRPQQQGYGNRRFDKKRTLVNLSEIFDKEENADPIVYNQDIAEKNVNNPTTKMRLNRYIAMSGVCSRREADELIKQGLVKINGQVVSELGVAVNDGDVVEYDGRILTAEKKIYIVLNKPKDTVTTTEDPQDRRTVLDLVKGAGSERIYPIGRLDRNTTGVLLLTNDGDMAEKLLHPRYGIRKIYHVFLDKRLSEADMQKMAEGITLPDGPIAVDDIRYVDPADKKQVGVQIHSGRNRIVRRMFDHLGYHVEKLDRVYFAGLTKINLPRGKWRHLTETEVNKLKAGFVK